MRLRAGAQAREMATMSNQDDSFLERWSKRKVQARAGGTIAAGQKQAEAEPEEIALEDLPPIEAIDASTDLTYWLRKKVPDAWRQAALKRVWAADPAISQFTGLAENAWDWNAPDGVPGFGPLGPTHNVAQLLAQVIGKLPEPGILGTGEPTAASRDRPPPEPGGADRAQMNLPKEAPDAQLLDESLMDNEPPPIRQNESATINEQQPTRRRRGGGALPS
jgi:hypothetical protein